MKVLSTKYELVPIDSITEHPENPRMGNEEEIGKSIQTNKFYGACIVQLSTKHIVVGNHRYRQLKSQGASHVPVIWADVDDATALKILLADNKTRDNSRGKVRDDQLHEALEFVSSGGGLDGNGYLQATLDRLREEQAPPVPPPDGEEMLLSEVSEVTVALGHIRFKISHEQYENWINRMLRENSFNVRHVAKAMRKDLKA